MRRVLPLLCAVLALVACNRDSKKVDPPAELVKFKPTLEIQQAWSTGTGGGDDDLRLALAPAVQEGRVFTAGTEGEVQALALANGKRIWSTDTKLPLSAGPGAGFGLVAAGSSEGDVVVLDASNGALRWKSRVGAEVMARPAIGEGRVVVHTVDGRIHALRAADGSVAWNYEQPSPRLTLRGSSPPVVVGENVVVGFDNGKVVALALANGDVLWETTVSPGKGRSELERLVDVDAAVQVSGNDVYVAGFQGRAAMIAMENGQGAWSRDLSSHRGLALDDESLYVTLSDGTVVAMSRRDGSERWRTAALLRRGVSAPAVFGDAVVVGDFEGYLHWMDRATGRFVARTKAGGRITNGPVVADGLLLVQPDKGGVRAFRLRPPGKRG
ncbi:MAG: outer membrane protein assembly factor BamB [Steroidobacteraceae bacterium]